MNRHWYLIGKRAGARVFEQEGIKLELRLIQAFENHLGSLKTNELVSDRQGRSESSRVNGHNAVGKDDSAREHILEKFAAELGKFLEHEAQKNMFSSLVLVAEPHVLGVLKKSIGKVTSKLEREVVVKDLAHVSNQDMVIHLKDALFLHEEIRPA